MVHYLMLTISIFWHENNEVFFSVIKILCLKSLDQLKSRETLFQTNCFVLDATDLFFFFNDQGQQCLHNGRLHYKTQSCSWKLIRWFIFTTQKSDLPSSIKTIHYQYSIRQGKCVRTKIYPKKNLFKCRQVKHNQKNSHTPI